MKVWITKYALTAGIQEASNAEQSGNGFGGMISVPSLGGFTYFHGEGKDWHKTEESAKKRAEFMRLAKIKALDKQLAKLKAMKFI